MSQILDLEIQPGILTLMACSFYVTQFYWSCKLYPLVSIYVMLRTCTLLYVCEVHMPYCLCLIFFLRDHYRFVFSLQSSLMFTVVIKISPCFVLLKAFCLFLIS